MSYVQILYHIVFATNERKPCLTEPHRHRLYEYVSGILTNKKCHLYRMNGTADHVHLLCTLHPNISLADLVKVIKTSSTSFIKDESLFPQFTQWQEGYGAFTCTYRDKDSITGYIDNQEEHHRTVTFREEFEAMLKAAGIEYDPKYL